MLTFDIMEIILSVATSSDGYIDDDSPARLKLSTPEDWAEVLELRASCDAILVGANTVRRDNPSLVIRDPELRARRVAAGLAADIIKVTVTASGNLDPDAAFFTDGAGRKIVFATEGADVGALAGVAEIIVAERLNASFIADALAARGVRRLMVEGGAKVLAMFLDEGVADRLRLAVSPVVVDGGVRLPPLENYRMQLESTWKSSGMTVTNYILNNDK